MCRACNRYVLHSSVTTKKTCIDRMSFFGPSRGFTTYILHSVSYLALPEVLYSTSLITNKPMVLGTID
jgi:hypothetical protein